jgi:2-phospho-L-lactate guanylyltransferase (CobY/MobA/RfbA family)
MATVIIPFRVDDPKRRLAPLPAEARREIAWAMFVDVWCACSVVAEPVLAGLPGSQQEAVLESLRHLYGPIAIVNADLPCAHPTDIQALLEAAPAYVAAADGTTNALSLPGPEWFRPLYGPGSAARFRELGLRELQLPNLADDVDTVDDLERVGDRIGTRTREALDALRVLP